MGLLDTAKAFLHVGTKKAGRAATDAAAKAGRHAGDAASKGAGALNEAADRLREASPRSDAGGDDAGNTGGTSR